MAQILTMVSVLGPPLIALAGLALRLRWQALRDQRRQDTLRTLTSRLPADGVVDIEDLRDDGSRLHMRVSTAPEPHTGRR
ncbi:hypothetical protein [Amycolatopsis sp. 195334CR]|uniref:hypothetical protein n=1 Tax=Amycolatopsis sp. 195334CR TaxID=2814588 RepID=UPI001A8CB194|nr:hypothetical protein [Amycolatopsis sp. 195334CR]MBN6040022.1 hypothetical protein [Amycolatopsis sp. 195334CR]